MLAWLQLAQPGHVGCVLNTCLRSCLRPLRLQQVLVSQPRPLHEQRCGTSQLWTVSGCCC